MILIKKNSIVQESEYKKTEKRIKVWQKNQLYCRLNKKKYAK